MAPHRRDVTIRSHACRGEAMRRRVLPCPNKGEQAYFALVAYPAVVAIGYYGGVGWLRRLKWSDILATVMLFSFEIYLHSFYLRSHGKALFCCGVLCSGLNSPRGISLQPKIYHSLIHEPFPEVLRRLLGASFEQTHNVG